MCCRWGYKDVEALEAVVANYSKAGLPLEGLWVDIEAMNNRFQVFTFDTGDRLLKPLLVPVAISSTSHGLDCLSKSELRPHFDTCCCQVPFSGLVWSASNNRVPTHCVKHV